MHEGKSNNVVAQTMFCSTLKNTSKENSAPSSVLVLSVLAAVCRVYVLQTREHLKLCISFQSSAAPLSQILALLEKITAASS